MTVPTLASGVPVLRSLSDQKTREFYVEFLGMAVDWEHRFRPDLPLYMALSRDGLRLHLSEHFGDATPGSTVFVPVQNIAALHAELMSRQPSFCRPVILDQPWGKEMTLTDPSGNNLRFCERP